MYLAITRFLVTCVSHPYYCRHGLADWLYPDQPGNPILASQSERWNEEFSNPKSNAAWNLRFFLTASELALEQNVVFLPIRFGNQTWQSEIHERNWGVNRKITYFHCEQCIFHCHVWLPEGGPCGIEVLPGDCDPAKPTCSCAVGTFVRCLTLIMIAEKME